MTNKGRPEIVAYVRSTLAEMNLPISHPKTDEGIEELIWQLGVEALLAMRDTSRNRMPSFCNEWLSWINLEVLVIANGTDGELDRANDAKLMSRRLDEFSDHKNRSQCIVPHRQLFHLSAH